MLHNAVEVGSIMYLHAAATGLEALSLLETLVVGTEDNGNIPYCSLQGVVDAYSETATDVGDIGIAIDAGEQAEAIDDEDASRFEV